MNRSGGTTMLRTTKASLAYACLLTSVLVLAGMSGPAFAATTYDGNWSVVISTHSGSCQPSARFGVQISNGVVVNPAGGQADVQGRVSPRGVVQVSVRAGNQSAVGSGRLGGETGGGVWRGQSSSGFCEGTWAAQRSGAATTAEATGAAPYNYGPSYGAGPAVQPGPDYDYAPGYAVAPAVQPGPDYDYAPGYAVAPAVQPGPDYDYAPGYAVAPAGPDYDYAPGYAVAPAGPDYDYAPGYAVAPAVQPGPGYEYAPGYAVAPAVQPGPDYDYAPGYAVAPAVQSAATSADSEVAACEARFRSYNPSTGTYLGFDGARHPCP
jgi:BA14K-like protein